MLRRTFLVAAVVAASAVPAMASAGANTAATPPSLTGENLASDSFTCDEGDSGSFTFSASGAAVGPYTGTFTESATVSFDSTTGTQTLSANFTITTNDGSGAVVTGTKTGTIPSSNCWEVRGDVPYSATIRTPSGDFTTTGAATVFVGFRSFFGEEFTTGSVPAPVQPPLPTNKSQCMNGGWNTYKVFKNQGDCVTFVATGGKNQPAGS